MNFKNIIIRMPNWLGDLVMATPIVADVRQKWPSSKITVMSQSNVAPLLLNNPNVDAIFSFQKPKGWLDSKNRKIIISTLKEGKYDLGLLLTNSFSSAWWFWRGNTGYRVGFSGNFRDALLNERVKLPQNHEFQHLVLTYKSLLHPLGISQSTTAPTLYVSAEEKLKAQQILHNHHINFSKNTIIGVNPGAAYGSAKCWLPERFIDVTKKLLSHDDISILYFGDSAGVGLVNQICHGFDERVVNLAGKTNIRELIALIETCSVFLTNDSGPMHIASALNVPLLALFGSTSDVKTGPYQLGKVIHKHVECSPCYRRSCPIDFRCMTQISSDEVYDALINVLLGKSLQSDKQHHRLKIISPKSVL